MRTEWTCGSKVAWLSSKTFLETGRKNCRRGLDATQGRVGGLNLHIISQSPRLPFPLQYVVSAHPQGVSNAQHRQHAGVLGLVGLDPMQLLPAGTHPLRQYGDGHAIALAHGPYAVS